MGAPQGTIDVVDADESRRDALVRLFGAYRIFYGRAPDPQGAATFIGRLLAEETTRFFVAEIDGVPVGFAHLLPSWDTLAMRPMWILEDLFVAPAFRRCGVAGALLARVERFARMAAASRISLSTAHTNVGAQRVYAAHGYERDETFQTHHRLLR